MARSADLDEIIKRGVIRIGCAEIPDINLLKDPALPYYMGFDLELAMEISTEFRKIHGASTEWVHVPRTDQRIPFLQDGKADLIIRTFSITSKRLESINFSDSYFDNPGLTVVIPKGVTGIASFRDLAGRKVMVTGKSTAEYFVLKNVPKVKILPVANDKYAVDYLLKGKADAYVQDFAMCLFHVSRFPDLRLVGDPFTMNDKKDEYGIGMQKGSDNLKKEINGILTAFEKKGFLKKLYDKWFGEKLAQVRKVVPLIGGKFDINAAGMKLSGTLEEKRGDFYLFRSDDGATFFFPPSSIQYLKVIEASPQKQTIEKSSNSKNRAGTKKRARTKAASTK
jgi:ABC-type amino acid transport substrate-binding protein